MTTLRRLRRRPSPGRPVLARAAAPLLAMGSALSLISLLLPGYVRTDFTPVAIFLSNVIVCGIGSYLVNRLGIARWLILPLGIVADLGTVPVAMSVDQRSAAAPLILTFSVTTLFVALFGTARAAALQVAAVTASACALLWVADDPWPAILVHVLLVVYAAGGSAYIVVRLRTELEAAVAGAQQQSVTDALTATSNRRGFEAEAPSVVRRAARSGWPVSVLLGDVDHFKRVNDCFGHAAGDAVLCTVADAIRGCLREGDVVARLGGEEFAVLTTMPAEGLHRLAERIRTAVAESCGPWGVTISVGGSWAHLDAPDRAEVTLESIWSLVEAADGRMFEAKREGRNRCRI